MSTVNFDVIVSALHHVGIPRKELDQRFNHLILDLLQLIAEGEPVTVTRIKEKAAELQITEAGAEELIKQTTERDKNDDIVGAFGLSQNKYQHRFEVNNKILSTWCAWDTLFLPILLDQTADVVSHCPVTKQQIRLQISPERIVEYTQQDAVLSIVLPDTEIKSAAEVYQMFCHHVFFFSSKEALAQWFKHRDMEPITLSLKDGYRLGQLVFKELAEAKRSLVHQ